MANMNVQRSILTSAVFRFSPQTQPIRETALNRIVENALYHSGDGSESIEISDLFREKRGIAASPAEVKKTLQHLCEEGRIRQAGTDSYFLDPDTREELDSQHQEAQQQQRKIVEELLRHTKGSTEDYTHPFLMVLSRLFAELGEESVRLLQGDSTYSAQIDSNSTQQYCERAAKGSVVDEDILQQAVEDFFDSNDPDYNSLKWKLAQNFFISKSIGLNHGGSVIAGETFENAVFYIDTNITIPALEPADRLHYSFKLITDACQRLNAKIKVCRMTIDELNDLISHKFGQIKDSLDVIGDRCFEETDSIFSRVYRSKKENGQYSGIRSLFENFDSPRDRLFNEYNVETSRESWFRNSRENTTQTERLITQVRRASREKRGEDKNPHYQAKHDALLLQWVQYQRQQGYNAWILTADTSLPAVEIPDHEEEALAITINALLQWLSPIMGTDADEKEFQSVFADLVRKRVLPQDRFFKMSDFAIFKDLDISLKQLPKSDVRKCVQIVKSESAKLDLNKAEDRERLNHKIQGFLSDPGSGYKKELLNLEGENEDLRSKNEKNRARISNLESQLNRYQGQIDSIQEERKEEREKRRLWRSGWVRAGVVAVATVILIGTIAYFADESGNQIIKYVGLKSWWPIYSVLLTASSLVGGWWIGPKRLKAMGFS